MRRWAWRTDLIPVQQKPIHKPPYNILPSPLCLPLSPLKLPPPSRLHPLPHRDLLLLIQMIMAPMICGYRARGFHGAEEGDEARPIDGAGGGIPILHIVNRVDRDLFLRLRCCVSGNAGTQSGLK